MQSDINLLIKNYQLLIDNFDKIKKMPKCVVIHPLKISVCCGQGKIVNKFLLTDLISGWKNGFLYKNKPIIHIYGKNGLYYIYYIDNNKIKKVHNININCNIKLVTFDTEITLSNLINQIKEKQD